MARNNQISHILVGRRTLVSENVEHNWEPLDINDFQIPHGKVAFMFGGNITTGPEEGNGNAKILESFLTPENRKKTNIYSFIYKTEPLKSENYVVPEYENETQLIFEKIFKPLLFDSKGNMKEIQGIEKVFQKLIFASHCVGSHFVNMIIDNYYALLLQKFPETTAEMLINKIQYFSYAPLELPLHNLNALYITPCIDVNHSWYKALEVASSQKVEVDYPRHTINSLLKAQKAYRLEPTFNSIFEDSRAIVFRVGKSTFMIPSRMNPRLNIGDHSIECISKKHILNSDTELADTAQAANYAAKTIMNVFASDSPCDTKLIFSKITNKLEESPPLTQRAF